MSEQQQQSRAEQDPYAKQRELAATQEMTRVGLQSQQEKVSKHKMNPGFYREIADLHADTEQFNWLENAMGAKSAPGHILGNHEEGYTFERKLLNRNWSDRMIAERSRGRLWLKNPSADAVIQGLEGGGVVEETPDGGLRLAVDEHPDYVAPIHGDSNHRRQYRDLADLQTTRESLGVEGEALGALTKATTETRHHDEQQQETDATGRMSRLISR